MSTKNPSGAVMRDGLTVVWFFRKEGTHTSEISPGACPMCGAMNTITALPPPLLAVQPDDTTHVCHPAIGGCNHGFAKT